MLGDGQEVEDPAAAVVDADDLERHAGAARRQQAAGVVLERELADQDPGGEARGDRRAERRRDDAVDPVRAAVGEEAEPLRRLREVGLDVADRHRRADPDDAPRRAARARGSARTLPSKSSGAASTAAHALRVARSLQPSSQPVIALRRAHLHRARERARGSARPPPRSTSSAVLVGSCQAPCGSTTICDDSATQRAKGLRRGHVADPQHQARRVRSRANVLDRGAARRSARSRASGRGRRTARRRSARRAAASPPRAARRAAASATSS